MEPRLSLGRVTPRVDCAPVTWHNTAVYDVHVQVPIWAGVLVPKADHVTKLVHHDAKFITVLADRDGLRSVASAAYERAAAIQQRKNIISITMTS